MSRDAGTLLERPSDRTAVGMAQAAATRAASDARVRIVELGGLHELEQASRLWRGIWAREGEPPVSSELLRAFSHAGDYVCGAYEGEALLGALLGFYGGGAHGPDHLHSHILGVAARSRGRGVGAALKLHQRAWALERGITTVTWTYDPLVRQNGFFNIVRLGATGVEYLVDFYGDMPDVINSGDRSDRILVRWDLVDERAVAAAAGIRRDGDLSRWLDLGATVALDAGDGDHPMRRDASGELVLCATPHDIVALRRTDIDAATDWRAAVRGTMIEALQRGLRITGMTRSGSYVLTRRP